MNSSVKKEAPTTIGICIARRRGQPSAAKPELVLRACISDILDATKDRDVAVGDLPTGA